MGTPLSRAGVFDTFAVLTDVVLPTLAKGVIMRRPAVLSFAERFNLDRRGIRRMQRIRKAYGTSPLLLRIPGRQLVLVLDPHDVHRVLADSPQPFATASKEKVAALAHFEPKGVLISSGEERADRRRYNEEVLEANRPVHHVATSFVKVVDSEAERMCRVALARGELTWPEFSDAWFRIVRRVIFGDSASDDHKLSETMTKLRSAANWAFLMPQRTSLRDRLFSQIRTYLQRAEPHSLAGVMAHTHSTPLTAPEHQVPQWLFAFDAAGMAAFRALALLTSHPEYGHRVRKETTSARELLPLTRAAVLESLRLWPTTPLILRETRTETGSSMGVVIYTPFFHRDDERLPYADRFAPELWSNGEVHHGWPLLPFSEGPAMCPGRQLVLLLTTAMIAAILDHARIRLKDRTRLNPERPLPATLNHFTLRFDLIKA